MLKCLNSLLYLHNNCIYPCRNKADYIYIPLYFINHFYSINLRILYVQIFNFLFIINFFFFFFIEEPNDNANMIAAVSLPNESEEENLPKKEVTHHLPPGAYPVYPQFMGMLS